MSKATDALSFLRSFWGVLATVAVTFPGAAAIFKIPIAVENSKIAILYPVVGVIVSAFALLLATTYRDKFTRLEDARKWAVTSMAVALISFFGFVGVRIFLLDMDVREEYVQRDGEQLVKKFKARGVIAESVRMKGDGPTAIPNIEMERGDPWDIAALALFTSLFAALSVSFSTLGLHVYVV
jgi:hypothetical protein